jgi:glutathione synthase
MTKKGIENNMKRRHIFLIDPLEKLNFKKDTSLFMALTLSQQSQECYLLFCDDFYFMNHQTSPTVKVYSFQGQFVKDHFYLENFSVDFTHPRTLQLNENDTVHMRIDPPFDSRYNRYLWILLEWEKQGIRVVNRPGGIFLHNEKIKAYSLNKEVSLPSFVGTSWEAVSTFMKEHKTMGEGQFIIKPLDFYQGIGVEKINLGDQSERALEKKWKEKIQEFNGPIVCQPFYLGVTQGEVRSLYFNGKELGSILKTPKAGEYLANIAQGATFESTKLSEKQRKTCEAITKEYLNEGISLVAFDILGPFISEINVTCPGLMVEVSQALKRNVALGMFSADPSYL